LYLVLLRNLLDSYSKFQVLIVMKRVVLYSEHNISVSIFRIGNFWPSKGETGAITIFWSRGQRRELKQGLKSQSPKLRIRRVRQNANVKIGQAEGGWTSRKGCATGWGIVSLVRGRGSGRVRGWVDFGPFRVA